MHYCNIKYFDQIYKVLRNTCFIMKTCLFTVLFCSFEYYKILEIGLTGFEVFMQKIQRKYENRKE
jgi:hypothetical protein